MGEMTEDDIFEIIRHGDLRTLEQILRKNPKLTSAIDTENEETTVLISAVESGSYEMVEAVLRCKPDVNATNQYGMTALHSATKLDNMDCVKLLVENGAQCIMGMCGSPLAVAVFHGHLEMLEYFISIGEDVNSENLLAEAIMHAHECLVDCLLKNGCEVNKRYDSTNALHIASATGNTNIVHLLLEAGADIDVLDTLGTTPLLIATRSGHKDIVKVLLDRGADPNVKDNTYSTLSACHYAAQCSQTECLKILLRSGANPNLPDQNGFTPLMRAICGGSHQTCLILIFENCEVNCSGTPLSFNHRLQIRLSPLELAIKTDCMAIAKLLVICGLSWECLAKAQSLLVQKRKINKDGEGLLELINEKLRNPTSLYSIVAFKIRHLLGCPLSTRIAALPVPQSVKKAIQLRDELDSFADTLDQEPVVQRGALAHWMPARWINHDENMYASN